MQSKIICRRQGLQQNFAFRILSDLGRGYISVLVTTWNGRKGKKAESQSPSGGHLYDACMPACLIMLPRREQSYLPGSAAPHIQGTTWKMKRGHGGVQQSRETARKVLTTAPSSIPWQRNTGTSGTKLHIHHMAFFTCNIYSTITHLSFYIPLTLFSSSFNLLVIPFHSSNYL